MRVTGRFHHVLDDQSRLAIPSAIRNTIIAAGEGSALYLIPQIDEKHMLLIPEGLFDHYLEQLDAGLLIRPEKAVVRRIFLANVARLEPDKAGRVAIPEEYLASSKKGLHPRFGRLEREVTIVAQYDRIEIWSRRDYEAHEMAQLDGNAPALRDGIMDQFGDLLGKHAAKLAEKSTGPGGAGN